MSRTEVRVSGFGGQGIILSGYIIGKAAAIFDKKNATMTQAYGPESRGGACSSQVVISEQEINDPEVSSPDVVVAMSQEAYTTFTRNLKSDCVVLIDEDLVQPDPEQQARNKTMSVPAMRLAEEMGKKVVANIIMLGFFAGKSGVVSHTAMEQAILSSVPPRFAELNKQAFERGYELATAKI
jgi:2-oxoglutarate ferredoxin oxidoreductase subunit gamma